MGFIDGGRTRSRPQYDRDVFYYDSFRAIFQRQLKLEKGNSVVNQRDSEHLCRLVSNVEWSWNRCSVCFFGIFCTVVELLCVCSCLCYSATHKMTTEETSTHYLHFFGCVGFGADPASAPTASRGQKL